MRNRPLFALLPVAAVLAGCVVVIDAARARDGAQRAWVQAEENVRKSQADLAEKAAAIDGLEGRGVPGRAPFPEARTLLKTMDDRARSLLESRDAAARSREEFLALASKGRVRSDDPDYTKVRAGWRDLSAAFELVDERSKGYAKASAELSALMTGNRMGRVDAAELRPRVEAALKKMDDELSRAALRVAEARRRLPRVETAERPAAEKTLGGLDACLSDLRTERRSFAGQAEAFYAEAGADRVIWVMPGMASESILAEMEGSAARMRALVERFNARVAEAKR